MSSVVVVTSDPAITVSQDNPAISVVVPVTTQLPTQIGFGVSTVLSPVTDFNTVTTAGFYSTLDALSVNAPVSSQLWYLRVEVQNLSVANCHQIATIINNSTVQSYSRMLIAGVWGAWQQDVMLNSSGSLVANLAPRGYLSGLTLSPAGGSATFGVAAGVATDSTNSAAMTLAAAYSKTTSAWTVGNGTGALDTGAIAASTWYHVYLIKRPDTGTVDILLSLSATAPILPTSYTFFRRVGSLLTDGSSLLLKYVQTGNEFLWDVPPQDFNALAGGVGGNLVTASAPPGTEAIISMTMAAGSTGILALAHSLVAGASQVPNVPLGNIQFSSNVASAANPSCNLRLRLNAARQFRLVATASCQFWGTTIGWIDQRGMI